MLTQEMKCALVIDESLPTGLITNTAVILGITIGKQVPEVVGSDVADASGQLHRGIVKSPVPVLCGNQTLLRQLREKLRLPEFSALLAVDFSDVAQECKTYDEFVGKIEQTDEAELGYFGIGICGDKKLVNRLTGNLPLLR